MNTIYKYQLDLSKTVSHKMPEGAQVLTVGIQRHKIMLWALVKAEPPYCEEAKELRTFRCYGTGHPIQDQVPMEYIGTLYDGPFVWHVFEIL